MTIDELLAKSPQEIFGEQALTLFKVPPVFI